MNSNSQGGMQLQTHSKQQMLNHPSQMATHLNQQNHLNATTVYNHGMTNSGGIPPMPIFDHMQGNVNGVGLHKPAEQLIYLGGQPHLSVLPPQNQYMNTNSRNAAVSFI